jgi:hypothetical protein
VRVRATNRYADAAIAAPRTSELQHRSRDAAVQISTHRTTSRPQKQAKCALRVADSNAVNRPRGGSDAGDLYWLSSSIPGRYVRSAFQQLIWHFPKRTGPGLAFLPRVADGRSARSGDRTASRGRSCQGCHPPGCPRAFLASPDPLTFSLVAGRWGDDEHGHGFAEFITAATAANTRRIALPTLPSTATATISGYARFVPGTCRAPACLNSVLIARFFSDWLLRPNPHDQS